MPAFNHSIPPYQKSRLDHRAVRRDALFCIKRRGEGLVLCITQSNKLAFQENRAPIHRKRWVGYPAAIVATVAGEAAIRDCRVVSLVARDSAAVRLNVPGRRFNRAILDKFAVNNIKVIIADVLIEARKGTTSGGLIVFECAVTNHTALQFHAVYCASGSGHWIANNHNRLVILEYAVFDPERSLITSVA